MAKRAKRRGDSALKRVVSNFVTSSVHGYRFADHVGSFFSDLISTFIPGRCLQHQYRYSLVATGYFAPPAIRKFSFISPANSNMFHTDRTLVRFRSKPEQHRRFVCLLGTSCLHTPRSKLGLLTWTLVSFVARERECFSNG